MLECSMWKERRGKCLLTNLLPKFAIQMVQGDNRYNLKVMYNVWAKEQIARMKNKKNLCKDQTQKRGVENMLVLQEIKQ